MAHHRHKRETNARTLLGSLPRLRPARPYVLAAPLAIAATLGAVSIGVLGADATTAEIAVPARPDAVVVGDASGAVPRGSTLSRGSVDRLESGRPSAPPAAGKKKSSPDAPETALERLLAPEAVAEAIAGADTKRFTTEALNLWTGPSESSTKTGVIDAGEPVLLTGRERDGRVEIVWAKTQTRWVTDDYLTDEKPPAIGAIGADCTNGTSVPDGVSANVKKVHAAVCAAFPDVTTYGTFRNDGEHSQGLAVDIMVSGAEGTQIAEFVRAHSADLGVNYVIYQQQIWSVERGGEGWRGMDDRGSVTANHFDHVHVTVF
ncbi:SH3 domain-containing protein [Nocardioides plantarum]|uniref:SH3b domain-containing protein n=1 Tax=Nocardioides plantarum TaxID=29299 RepID=A0ABV5KGT0_9ACTN|nr:SH3 domain-containing protein [Nocardioides plantarum]